jgi:Flp pilus assembly protein TadG
MKINNRSPLHKLLRFTKGSSLVEMALVLPMLMLIVTGIFTFAIAINNYVQLTNAVATGAQLLAISRGQTLDPCSITSTAIINGAPTLTPSSLTFKYVINGNSYSGTSCSSSSTTTGAAGNLQQGATAQVTVTYPCNLSVYGHNYAPTCKLQAQTTELVQ